MNNSARWKAFITWWREDVHDLTYNKDSYELVVMINKKIDEIQRGAKCP